MHPEVRTPCIPAIEFIGSVQAIVFPVTNIAMRHTLGLGRQTTKAIGARLHQLLWCLNCIKIRFKITGL